MEEARQYDFGPYPRDLAEVLVDQFNRRFPTMIRGDKDLKSPHEIYLGEWTLKSAVWHEPDYWLVAPGSKLFTTEIAELNTFVLGFTAALKLEEKRRKERAKQAEILASQIEDPDGDEEKQEALDEIVHDLFSLMASDVNNRGVESQIEALIEHLGLEGAKRELGLV